MKKFSTLFASIFFFLFFSTPLTAQETVSGTVFLDKNSNNQMDPGEEGIRDVAVSNGEDVVLSGEDGTYQLPIEEEMIVFISKPAGYYFPLDEDNLPQFYYIHHPEGSPKLEYPGVEPTGPLPESVNFGLISGQKKEKFTAVVFGDPQPRDNKELSYFRDDIVSELIDIDADFTIVLGDIMYDNLSMYERYNKIMRSLDMPVFNVLGNHDLNLDVNDNRYARETYKQYYGPTYYSFNYGDVHFMVLDNIDYSGLDKDGHTQYQGYFNDKKLSWIRNNLQYVDKDKLIVFLAHIPLYNTGNKKELIQMLNQRDKILFLGGHRHNIFNRFFGKDSGRMNPTLIHDFTTATASGTWWGGPNDERGIPTTTQMDGVPNGYHIFQFESNAYKEQYKAANYEKSLQMRIESPASNLKKEELPDSVLVNVFNGNEKSEVRFRIGDQGDWTQMERLERHQSPYFVHLTKKYDSFHRYISTIHIWGGNLPELKKGVHKITVWTRDMYGQEFTESKVIEIK